MYFFHEGNPFSLESQKDLNHSHDKIFMFDRYVHQVRPADSSQWDDNLVDNFVHKHLFIQFVQS